MENNIDISIGYCPKCNPTAEKGLWDWALEEGVCPECGGKMEHPKKRQITMNKKTLRCGIVARVDNGGLANLAFDYWKNIPEITKSLTIVSGSQNQRVDRYPEQVLCQNYPTLEQIDEFLRDIDVVVAFETPYNWNVFSKAKEKGIKTVLIPMYEWTEEKPPIEPDLYLCPSLMERDIYKFYPTK